MVYFLAGAVCLSGPTHAQDCTVAPWSSSVGLTDSDVGTPNEGIPRFSGFCGLSVPIDGTARYLTDDSPVMEPSYDARFYARVSGTNNPIMIFAAYVGSDPIISVWANQPDAGKLQLRMTDTGGGVETTWISVSEGVWHEIGISWESDISAEVEFSVDSLFTFIENVDTSGLSVSSIRLGNISAATGGGAIEFDEFASRRLSYPVSDSLLPGDSDGDGIYTGADQIALHRERLDNQLANGQPDCNRDGYVDQHDADCLREKRLEELSFPLTSESHNPGEVAGGLVIFDNGFEPIQ